MTKMVKLCAKCSKALDALAVPKTKPDPARKNKFIIEVAQGESGMFYLRQC